MGNQHKKSAMNQAQNPLYTHVASSRLCQRGPKSTNHVLLHTVSHLTEDPATGKPRGTTGDRGAAPRNKTRRDPPTQSVRLC